MNTLVQTIIHDDGSITLPLEYWESIGVQPGESVVIESDGTSILIRTLKTFEAEQHRP